MTMTTANTDLARAFPTLASLNMTETKAFYVEALGFHEIVHEAPDYLIVRRDNLELHFWLTGDPIFPQNTSCYIRGGQIVALYDEFKTRAVNGLSLFETRAWGMKEFTVHDPHGNLLRFGAAPQEIS